MDEGLLSDIARRRLAALLLIAGTLIAVLAITDAGPFGDPPTPEELAERTVREFYAAAAEGDFERYCELLTEVARVFIVTTGARAIEQEDAKPSCADVVTTSAGKAFAESHARIRDVSVSGNRARAEVDLELPGEEFPQPRTVMLEQDERKDWRISDPG